MSVDLQTLFYAVGIIYMIVALLIVLAIIILIFYIRRKIIQMKKVIKKPADNAINLGSDILLKGIAKLKKFFS
ncbi:MAG: hypothetical protein AAB801_01725 [Patescibacteria group bacterium]